MEPKGTLHDADIPVNGVQIIKLPFQEEADREVPGGPVPVYRWFISVIRFATYGPISVRFGNQDGYETASEAWGAAGGLFDGSLLGLE